MSTQPHIWKGVNIEKLGQLVDAIGALQSREEAQDFIAAYRAVNPHADANAGYVTGYLNPQRAEELRGWMNTAHPIFGMKSPTMAAALEAGKRAALGEFPTERSGDA